MHVAAVDTMGCEVQKKNDGYSKDDKAYHVLISLMLSAQTKDEVTHATTQYMVDNHNLSVKTILKTPEKTLNQWIAKVGFHNRKAMFIKQATKILAEKHKGKVPSNYDDLIALPGVGPKMAHLVLQVAYNDVQGVSVDTHVHRISGRLGWS